MQDSEITALAFVLALLVRVLTLSLNDDAVMLKPVQQQEVYLQEQMMPLQHEAEQMNVEQSWVGMPALLIPLLDYWKIWYCMALFLMFLWNLWRAIKRIQHADSSSEDDSSSSEEEEQEEEEVREQEEEQEEREDQEEQVEQVEQEEQERQQERQDQVERVEQQEQVDQADEEDEEDDDDEDFSDSALTREIARRALVRLEGRATRCLMVEELVNDLVENYAFAWSGTFFPVLQHAIGVGSTFEGWSPWEEDTVYRLLVPMEAPHGHVFLPELADEGDMLARSSRIRVELQCMCTREQQLGDVLCFLHNPEDELSQNQGPSLLQTLCTGSYLDVQKTAAWFNVQVAEIWRATHWAHAYQLKVLPSRRSCKLQLTGTSSGEKLHVELLFGLQQGDSDIFLSSQNTEAGFTPSTSWPRSCAVAEKKFFQYVASTAGQNSCHLTCLRLFAHILVGFDFSTYALKTLVLHLLTIIPLESWHRRNFLSWLENIQSHLKYCLQEKCLNHFLLGNENVPDEVVLPQAFQAASPRNLFLHLQHDPDAHSQALRDFRELKDRLFSLLMFGR